MTRLCVDSAVRQRTITPLGVPICKNGPRVRVAAAARATDAVLSPSGVCAVDTPGETIRNTAMQKAIRSGTLNSHCKLFGVLYFNVTPLVIDSCLKVH